MSSGGERVEDVGFDRTISVDIAEHEVLQVSVALESDAGLSPHGAVGAIAADEVTRFHALFATIYVPQ
jgi:hypothetical protein